MKVLNKNLLLLLFVVFYIICELYKFLLMFLSLNKFPEWILIVISIVFVVLLLLFYSKKINGKNIFRLNLEQIIFLLKSIFLFFCLYVICIPVFNIFTHMGHLDVNKISFFSLGELTELLSDNKQFMFFYFKAFCLSPVLEEILFRGFLQKYLYKIKLPFIAILIPAILFSFSHYDINKIFITFFPGLLYGFVYYKSDSLIIPILCHSSWNIFCYIFPEASQQISAYTIFLFILAIVGFVFLLRNIWKSEIPKLSNE